MRHSEGTVRIQCRIVYCILIKAGANPYAMDSEDFTALHHACIRKHMNAVQYLLKIAPGLLLLCRKPSLACFTPYLGIMRLEISLVVPKHLCQHTLYVFEVFLDNPACPSGIKFDIIMLRVVYQVLVYRPCSDIPRRLDVLKKFIASDIDPVMEVNGGVPVSTPREVTK